MTFDIKQQVTDQIIAAIESGATKKGQLWVNAGGSAMPMNYSTKRPYNGVNVLLLWLEAEARGFERQEWMTYKQATEIGAQVRKGAKGCPIVYFKMLEKDAPAEDGNAETKRIPMARSFTVFNVADIDGLPAAEELPGGFEPHSTAEHIMRASGAEIIEAGTKAFYRPATDAVHLPDRARFANQENFYHVAVHELTHWTGGEKRLNRDFSKRFGDEAYAFEELVAELGSAFMLSRIGLTGSELQYHASYIEGWLKVLRGDKNAIFTAASRASAAYQYLLDSAGLNTAEDADYAQAA